MRITPIVPQGPIIITPWLTELALFTYDPVMGGIMSTSWLALTALLVLCNCWMLAGGQTCSLSGTYYIAIS